MQTYRQAAFVDQFSNLQLWGQLVRMAPHGGWGAMRRFAARAALTLAVLMCAARSDAWTLFPPQPRVDQPAPPFTATLIDGRKVTLESFKGQVIVINRWATWCGPCRYEFPLLDAYYKANRERGLQVLALTTMNSGPLVQFAPLTKSITMSVGSGMGGGYDAPDGVPTNYVIDRAGVLRYARAGAFTPAGLKKIVDPLLDEPAPGSSLGPGERVPAAEAKPLP